MAGGRDLRRRSPRWLNCLIWSCGLASIGYFFWRLLASESDGNEVAFGTTGLVSRLAAAAVLPALLCITVLGRAARRLVGRPEERRLPRLLRAPIAFRAPKAGEGAAGSASSDQAGRPQEPLRLPSPPKIAVGS